MGTAAEACVRDGRGVAPVRSAPSCLSAGALSRQQEAAEKETAQSEDGVQHGIGVLWAEQRETGVPWIKRTASPKALRMRSLITT